jgi:pseudouridine synthase
LGTKANLETDEILLDGKKVTAPSRMIYLVLNKPLGYVTTVHDPHAEKTVMELVKDIPERIYPVGRLDADSAGILLMTNDGEFMQQVTHPSHLVEKTYRVLARGEVSEFAAADLRSGILLEDGMTSPAKVEWVDYQEEHNVTVVDITIHEGRNRQVRRMFDAVGYHIVALTRIRYGSVELTGLAPGRWRILKPEEISSLKDAVQ